MTKKQIRLSLYGAVPLLALLYFCWKHETAEWALACLAVVGGACAVLSGIALSSLRDAGVCETLFQETKERGVMIAMRAAQQIDVSGECDELGVIRLMGRDKVRELTHLSGNAVFNTRNARKSALRLLASCSVLAVGLFLFPTWSSYIVPVSGTIVLLGYSLCILFASSGDLMEKEFSKYSYVDDNM